MIKVIDIRLNTNEIDNQKLILKNISEKLNINQDRINNIILSKKSIDSRNKKIKYQLRYKIYLDSSFYEHRSVKRNYVKVNDNKTAVIIGFGTAGLFAGLRLIELGIKPIIFERGKQIRERRRDIANLNKKHILNNDSNYCFGEGGAGTFSDGKLYTRSKKRGDINRILETLVYHGADRGILIEAHPHIGTDKLPKIIKKMRETILNCGGEIHFNSRISNIITKENKIQKIKINEEKEIECKNIILATGHSARDIYYLLDKIKVKLELKEIAIGVRVEHDQSFINNKQYHNQYNKKHLPPASYNLSTVYKNRSIHSFCMCPGGIIAPCATNSNELVTNGWSPSRRDNKTANSGIVVQLKKKDFDTRKYKHFAALEFQKKIENKAYRLSNQTQKVPAQKLSDFMNDKLSVNIPKTSYIPGTISVKMSELFPRFIYETLRGAFLEFDKKMSGYISNNAIVHAPESRTSSPIRIPRNNITLENEQIDGLFPCGEGAGYAGGIMSAAIDGEKVAFMLSEKITKRGLQ